MVGPHTRPLRCVDDAVSARDGLVDEHRRSSGRSCSLQAANCHTILQEFVFASANVRFMLLPRQGISQYFLEHVQRAILASLQLLQN